MKRNAYLSNQIGFVHFAVHRHFSSGGDNYDTKFKIGNRIINLKLILSVSNLHDESL